MRIGTPLSHSATKILLLGSGELGKEFTIEAMRLGIEVIAVDSYQGAPAQQVAHSYHVIDMKDGKQIKDVVYRERPDFIVPEIEAIDTDMLVELENEGFNVVPCARATKLTMDRIGIRRLAAEELGLKTSAYRFAETFEEFKRAVEELGFPVVVKPVMSSSGKGQSVVKSEKELERAFRRWIGCYVEVKEHEVLAVDGKVLRGSRKKEKSVVSILSAVLAESNLIIAHKEIEKKSNEIPELQSLIGELDESFSYGFDALNTQKNVIYNPRG